jgi:fatty acid-binding protein DegV
VELSAANTAIVVDSTADFPEAPQRFPNWRVVPLYVRFGDESYRDYVELEPEVFYERLRAAPETPTTSQPTPGDFLDAYRDLEGYERILSLHIAGGLSGTIESARAAARLIDDERVRVLDSGSASAAIAMLGLAVQRRLERGTSDEEVDAVVERFRRDAGLLFTVDTLEYLARGGRIRRVRGNRKAFLEFASRFETDTADTAGLRVGIAHADAQQRADVLAQLVRERRPAAVLEVMTTLGPVLGAHAGPGTVGFFWFQDG